jgi:hypothetical protein
MRSPGRRGCILMEDMPFGILSAGPHCHDHPACVGGILDFCGFAVIFAGFDLLDFAIWLVLQAEVHLMLIWIPHIIHPLLQHGSS